MINTACIPKHLRTFMTKSCDKSVAKILIFYFPFIQHIIALCEKIIRIDKHVKSFNPVLAETGRALNGVGVSASVAVYVGLPVRVAV